MTQPRGLFFEDFELGYKVQTGGRTISEADIMMFAGLSGDWNPVHVDAEYAKTAMFGERVAHGDIVIVPTTHRLRVNKQGVILLELLPDNTQGNRPSIDQVLNDVADAFGANAGVIVFSGMAEDAAEGSVYLAGIGGRVYVQDPDTCVISSMVDGVIETGVVTFAGSPKALAGKVMGDLKMAARN